MFLSALLAASWSMTMPGGWTEQDADDTHVQELAQTALAKMEMKSNSLFASKLVEVTKARSQVVAGIRFDITFTIGMTNCRKGPNNQELDACDVYQTQECRVFVYERPWEKFIDITEPKCSELVAVKTRKRRFLVGVQEDAEVGDEGILAAVDFVMKDMNSRRNSLYRTMPVDLIDVKKQVVAGFKYSFTLLIGGSKCKNNGSPKSLEDCPVDKINGKMEKCYVEVHHQPWLEEPLEVIKLSCRPTKNNSVKKINPTNVDSKMNQIPLGSDEHDLAHWGVFAGFKQKFNKQYKNRAEEEMRFKIFRENMKRVRKLNDNELADAKYGITQFSDMAEEEFRRYYLNPKWDLSHRANLQVAEIPREDPPASFDWRDHNAVTPVKNQGMCGSCWAFSTTGNIEGIWAVQKSKLVSLSEQELVDCDKLDEGCNGGLPVNAYEEIIRLGGLETEKKYPYDGADEKCKFSVGDVSVYINGSVNISSNEADMAKWLYKNGPISIGINAMAMQFYMGGVSHPFSILCNPDDLDHGVLIVGYGIKKGWFSDSPYWIVKNSWGESWGEKGYYLVYRGDGVCGLNKMPTSAIVN